MRVLVAEDDAAALFLLRRAIEADGHECIAAHDGGMFLDDVTRATDPGVEVIHDGAQAGP